MQRNKIAQRIKSLPPVAYMLVVLIVIFSVMSPNYLTLMNFKRFYTECWGVLKSTLPTFFSL